MKFALSCYTQSELSLTGSILNASLIGECDGHVVVAKNRSARGAIEAEERGSNETFSIASPLRNSESLVEAIQLIGLIC